MIGAPSFREPVQYVFPSREDAEQFRTDLRRFRTEGRIAVRKALPEYRHGASPGFSVFVRAVGLGDAGDIASRARDLGGRPWKHGGNV